MFQLCDRRSVVLALPVVHFVLRILLLQKFIIFYFIELYLELPWREFSLELPRLLSQSRRCPVSFPSGKLGLETLKNLMRSLRMSLHVARLLSRFKYLLFSDRFTLAFEVAASVSLPAISRGTSAISASFYSFFCIDDRVGRLRILSLCMPTIPL